MISELTYSYTAELCEPGNPVCQSVANTLLTLVNFIGLKPCTEYTLTVRAKTEAGWGPNATRTFYTRVKSIFH